MFPLATFFVTAAAATLFALLVPLAYLYDGFGALTTALSIMAAALLVRLNRGMPSLEWKSMEPDRRPVVTAGILRVSRQYLYIVALTAVTLAVIVSLSAGKVIVFPQPGFGPAWPLWATRTASGLVGGLVALVLSRMAYVLWRDYDIAVLQARLIEITAERDATEAQAKIAEERLKGMKGSNLRAVENGEPKAWDHGT